ncbi:MAG: WD40 repeat domain-containing protein [Anaerolineae bacterium]|nr:WD40 repeat domain-containing protein [Anaerolineae bacterium]
MMWRVIVMSVLMMCGLQTSVSAQGTPPPILPFVAFSQGDVWIFGTSEIPNRIADNGLEPTTYRLDRFFDPVWSADGQKLLFSEGQALWLYQVTDDSLRKLYDPMPYGIYTFTQASDAIYFSAFNRERTQLRFYRADLNGSVPTLIAERDQDCRGGGGGAGNVSPMETRYRLERQKRNLIQATPYGLFYQVSCNFEGNPWEGEGGVAGLIDTNNGTVVDFGLIRQATVNGRYAVGMQPNNRLLLLDLETRTPIQIQNTALPDLAITSPRPSELIYYVTYNSVEGQSKIAIRLYDPVTQTDVELLPVDGYAIGQMAVTPDDRWLLYTMIPFGPREISGRVYYQGLLQTAPRLYALNLRNNQTTLIAEDAPLFTFNTGLYDPNRRESLTYVLPDLRAFSPYSLNPNDTNPVQRDPITITNAAWLRPVMNAYLPNVSQVQWSPQGRYLAMVADRTVYLRDMIDLGQDEIQSRQSNPIQDIALSGDGRFLAVEHLITNLYLIEDGDLKLVRGAYPGGKAIALNTIASQIAIVTDAGQVILITRAETGETEQTLTTTSALEVAFHPTQPLLAIHETEGIALWDTLDGQQRALLPLEMADNAQGSVVFSRDGQYLAVASDTETVVFDWANERVLQSYPRESLQMPSSAIDFLPNTSIVVVNDNLNPQNNFDTGYSALFWAGNAESYIAGYTHPGLNSLSFSPDGTLMATAGGDQVRIWSSDEAIPFPAAVFQYSSFNVLAECETFGLESPRIDERQTIGLVWSWYARTLDDLNQQIDFGLYRVAIDGQPLTNWQYLTRPIQDPANNNDLTTYWYIPIGALEAGDYRISLEIRWLRDVYDGYNTFNASPDFSYQSGCSLTVD